MPLYDGLTGQLVPAELDEDTHKHSATAQDLRLQRRLSAPHSLQGLCHTVKLVSAGSWG